MLETFTKILFNFGLETLIIVALLIAQILLIRMNTKTIRMTKVHADATDRLSESIDKNFNSHVKILEQMTEMTKYYFEQILKVTGSYYLDTKKSIAIYNSIAKLHINDKKDYIEKILKFNNLQKRKTEIKKNIEFEFTKLLNEHCTRLSEFNSIIGDMGEIIREAVKWNEILNYTYEIVFSCNSTIDQKLSDFKEMMFKYVIDIESLLRSRGEQNES